jgi:dTDP-4-dehydrorhamnose 3,5-epimerase-like enzyme
MRGAALVGAVVVDDWDEASRHADVARFVLSVERPSVLYIPAGYANGFMSLTEDAQLAVFSTSNIEESRDDDVRFDARYWDIWEVVEQ